MNTTEQRIRLLLRLTLDELGELAETAQLRSEAILATVSKTGGDLSSAREESLQLATVAAQVRALAEHLVRRARAGALAGSKDEARADD